MRSGAAEAATNFPVSMDPVKLILRGTGWPVMRAPSPSPPLTTFNTPGGSTSRNSQRGEGSEGRGLEDHGVAGEKRGGDLPEGQGEWEVPRGDGRHHAERAAHHLDEGVVIVLNDLRRGLEIGEVLAPDGGREDLDVGVRQWLALLRGENGSYLPGRGKEHIRHFQKRGAPGRLIALPVA